jgi:hypothetical protein
MAPIYQPVANYGYNSARLKLPATIAGTAIDGQTIVSMEVIE